MSVPETLQARLAFPAKQSENEQLRWSEKLVELGFSVVQTAPFGISFRGPVALFEKVFQSSVVDGSGGWTFAKAPHLPPEMLEAKASVYLPRKPEYPG